jgi:hypothetical protein
MVIDELVSAGWILNGNPIAIMNSRLPQRLLQTLALLLCLEFLGSSAVLAQSGDGGGASGVEPGDLGSGPSVTAGAEGPDTGSVNLSKGATIAIAVVCSVVVLFVGMSFLNPPGPSTRALTDHGILDRYAGLPVLLGQEEAVDHETNPPSLGAQSQQRRQSCHHTAHAQENDLLAC